MTQSWMCTLRPVTSKPSVLKACKSSSYRIMHSYRYNINILYAYMYVCMYVLRIYELSTNECMYGRDTAVID